MTAHTRYSLKRFVLAAAVAAVLVAAVGGAALAKGPESVSITGPGIEEPIELNGENHSQMTSLMKLTALWHSADGAERLKGAPQDLGDHYTITWVNFGPPNVPVQDRSIVQHIYVDGTGKTAINTPEQHGLSGWGTSVIGWFAASDELGSTLLSMVSTTGDEGAAATEMASAAADPQAAFAANQKVAEKVQPGVPVDATAEKGLVLEDVDPNEGAGSNSAWAIRAAVVAALGVILVGGAKMAGVRRNPGLAHLGRKVRRTE